MGGGGGTGTDLEGLGLVWNVWGGYKGSDVGEEGLGLVWRVYGGCKLPRKSMVVKDGYVEPEMGVKVFKCMWRA